MQFTIIHLFIWYIFFKDLPFAGLISGTRDPEKNSSRCGCVPYGNKLNENQ